MRPGQVLLTLVCLYYLRVFGCSRSNVVSVSLEVLAGDALEDVSRSIVSGFSQGRVCESNLNQRYKHRRNCGPCTMSSLQHRLRRELGLWWTHPVFYTSEAVFA